MAELLGALILITGGVLILAVIGGAAVLVWTAALEQWRDYRKWK